MFETLSQQKLADALKEAHCLVEKHVDSINRHSELETLAKNEMSKLQAEQEQLRNTIKIKTNELLTLTQELTKAKEDCTAQVSS